MERKLKYKIGDRFRNGKTVIEIIGFEGSEYIVNLVDTFYPNCLDEDHLEEYYDLVSERNE